MEKLLVMDDDEALRRLMRLELSDTYEIIDSGNPEQGLALALEHRPSAILLDLRMPTYSGYELCQTLASFSRTQMIPIIVVSGEAGAQTKEYCRQLGATDYFEKPIEFEALRACLRQVVKTREHAPRSEVRVRLRVPLKLRGIDRHGKPFEGDAMTENVSMSGFLCTFSVDLAVGAGFDVYLTGGDGMRVGHAQIMHAETQSESVRHYGCRFIEKTGPWLLQ